MPDPNVKIKVEVDGKSAESGFASLLGKIGELGRSIPGVGSAMGLLATGAAAAGAAFATLAKSISEYAEAEENVTKLGAALGKTGNLTKENLDAFQELAGELQKTTAIADDEWVAVMTKLVQFGSDPKSIGMDVEAVKNLAGIVGDLGTASSMYAKALQGQFAAFTRYGIVVGEAGTQTERLARLQEQLARIGGGQLEASASTLHGQFSALGLAVSDVFEAMGRGVAKTGILQQALSGLTFVAETVAEALGGPAEAVAGLVNHVNEGATANLAYIETLKQVAAASKLVTEATQAEIAAIKSRQGALDEVADHQMAADLAQVDEDVRSGKMRPSAGVRKRSAVRKAYAQAKFSTQEQSDLAVLKSQEEEYKAQLELLKTIETRRKAAESKATGSEPARRIQSDSNQLVAVLEKEKQREHDKSSTSRLVRKFFGMDAGENKAPLESETREAELAARIESIKALGVRGPKAIASREAEVEALRKDEEAQRGKVAASRQAILGSDLLTSIPKRRAIYQADSRRDSIVSGGEEANARRGEAEAALKSISGGNSGRDLAVVKAGAEKAGRELAEVAEVFTFVVDSIAQFKASITNDVRRIETQVKGSANK